jgi:hypothetical protein
VRYPASRHHKALARCRFCDCLCPMPIERYALAIDTKYPASLGTERAFCDEFIDTRSSLEVWIDADERLGLEPPASVDRINLLADVGGADLSE